MADNKDFHDPVAEAKGDQIELDAGQWSRDNGDLDDRPLLRDVAFNRHSRNQAGGWHHVSPLAHSENEVGVDGIVVRLVRGLPPEREVADLLKRAMNATTGYDVGEFGLVGSDEDEGDWRDVLRGGLQTVMESLVIVFEVSGVSRTCTHQIVRSRRAGFHQQSQRATSYVSPDGKGPNVRIPESVWRAIGGGDPGGTLLTGGDGEGDVGELAYAWDQALMWSRRAYRLALEADVSYQDARYILPEGTENYIMCEYTLREFLAVHDYRACSMFSWEIVQVVRDMGRLLKEQSPWIIGTGAEPKISCERTRHAIDDDGDRDGKLLGIGVGKPQAVAHACTFQGWEKVEGQCGFDWARESNRTFKPSRSI